MLSAAQLSMVASSLSDAELCGQKTILTDPAETDERPGMSQVRHCGQVGMDKETAASKVFRQKGFKHRVQLVFSAA